MLQETKFKWSLLSSPALNTESFLRQRLVKVLIRIWYLLFHVLTNHEHIRLKPDRKTPLSPP